tara:strand:+ start:359 stop:1684 length:1326 start_codon:yes stop_codon:yes gene_type:complete
MASKQSKPSVVSRGTSVRNQKKSYYVTDVTTLADGSVKRETYRTDKNGNNQVKISEVTAKPDGTIEDEVLSTATAQEKKDLANPDSKLRKTIKTQTDSVKQDIVDNNIDGVTSDTIDKAGGGSGNNQKTNDGDGGDANAPTDAGPELKDVKQRTDYQQVIRYPEDLDTNKQDFLKLMMVEYQPRGLNFQAGGLGIAPRGNLDSALSPDATSVGGRNILSNIFLPIPGGINDSNNVGWGDDKLDPVKLALTKVAGSFIMGEDVRNQVSQIAGGVQNNSEEVKDAAGAKITEGITGVNKLAREQGAVLNNNLELLFSGAQLRKFSFTFNFTPRSKDEAQSVLKIIRTLKQGMSAKKSNSFLFVKSPHTFFLGYYKGGSQRLHPFLNRFKECALTQLSVQYAPAGNYATYTDGSPTQYTVQMSFAELEPVFDDDYGDDYSNVGF